MSDVILSIEELAPREPRYVEVLGERYAVRPPEDLDLLQISRIEWLASFVGRGQGIPFETSHDFARAVRDLLVPTLTDDVLARCTPTQAYGFAVNLLVWALGELGRQIPPLLPLAGVSRADGSISVSSSRGSSGSTGGGRRTG
ncbi:hypothetical protein OO015_13785 (plasmid) [Thermomicrobium sp. 4228-Ro]|uniref:hypothetical protein n=1 Tax=Thermomicrobium sp. 4228-Ro TaxID=2993937 RepID=UPI002248F02F|nr:hypothetical protein [Thermomicrobium sp. 4228-Ro]MCX2728556.1 hypothetical protein [Thermomicrobium sp. 4228-Ro]